MTYKITPERQAMLDTINWCEGEPGYNQLFSYKPFDNNGPHPDVCIPFGDTCSTAAGRYQFLYNTWQDTIKVLGIPDYMSASNQDQAALQRIDYRGAMDDVDSGNIESAVSKLSYEWASLPPGRYGQPIKTLDQVLNYYTVRVNDLKKKTLLLDILLVILVVIIMGGMIWGGFKIYKNLK